MRKARWVLGWAWILSLLAGCRPVVQVRLVPGADLTSTALADVPTVARAQASDTPTPPVPTPPTATPTQTTATSTATLTPGPATPTPTATPQPSAVRIRFATGATSAVARGHLAAGQSHRYVLLAAADQILEVELFSDVLPALVLWGADGAFLKRSSDGGSRWLGTLPSSQDYTLEVSAGERVSDYGLRVTAFARIQVKAGETSATVSGPVDRLGAEGAEFVGGYVARAIAGQTLRATLSSVGGTVLLDVSGADGVSLTRYVSGETAWEGVLPSTQDYWVRPVSVGGDTRFTLTLWFSPLGLPEPERIRFAAGAVSATVGGHLAPGSYARYVLRASGGQHMQVRVLPAGSVGVAVDGPGGESWSEPAHGQGVDIERLPVAGDYVITLALDPGGAAVDYALQVTIR